MCSICRDKNCKYRFDKDKWNPKDEDDLVTVQIPESDNTFLEEVRSMEEALKTGLALPPGKLNEKRN